jgi:hypothetical protein
MADTTTSPFGFTKPEIGASEDTWGAKLNANWEAVDNCLDGTTAIKPNLTEGQWKVGGTAITATATELNYVDGVTSAIQTQLDAKAAKANNLSDLTNVATARTNLGLASLATKSTVNNDDWSGTDLSVANGGTGASTAAQALLNFGLTAVASELNLLDGITAILDQDDMSSNSATSLATQQSIKAYVDSKAAVTANAGTATSGTDFSVTTGPSGKALIFGVGTRDATFGNFGDNTLQLRKADSALVSASGRTMEYDSRTSGITLVIPYLYSGSANTTYTDFDLYWSSAPGTQRQLFYMYIGF